MTRDQAKAKCLAIGISHHERLTICREYIKEQIIAKGWNLKHFASAEITKAAKDLLINFAAEADSEVLR